MFRVENKDIRTTSTLNVSLVDFEEVNVCWDCCGRLEKVYSMTFGLF